MLRALPITCIAWIITAVGMYMFGFASLNYGSYVSFFGIVLFLSSFSMGMSAVVWTVNAEIYPLHVIGTANSLSTTTNWVSNFAVASVFLIFLETDLGSVLAFIALAVFAVCAWVFVYVFVPETAGLQIDEILSKILGSGYNQQRNASNHDTIDTSNE
jgi:hypothetical protein